MIFNIIENFCQNFMYDEALIYAEMMFNSNNNQKSLEVYAQVLYLMDRKNCVFYLIDRESQHIQLSERLLCLYGLSSIECNPTKAFKSIKTYLVQNEGSEYIHIVFAKLCRITGDSNTCRRHFEKAVKLNSLLIHTYKEAAIMGAKISEALFINKDSESSEENNILAEEAVLGDPGIVTRAHNTFLQSNLTISKSNLRIAVKSNKRKSSQVSADISSIKRQRLNPVKSVSKYEASILVDDGFKNVISAFELLCSNNFKESYSILNSIDALNKGNAFSSILRIICQHELTFPLSDVLFSISEHLENFEFTLTGIEHIIVILWINQDLYRLSDLKSKLIKYFPKSWQYYLCNGCLFALKHDTISAINELDASIATDQSGFSAGVGGWIAMADDRLDLASTYFNLARKRNNKDPRVLTGLGYLLMRTNNLPNALMTLQESERLKPNSETNKKLLAEVYRKSDKLAEAYEVLCSALSLYPLDKGLLNEKVILCIQMNLIDVFCANIGSMWCAEDSEKHHPRSPITENA
eukprot:NODE_230_length_13723_cov_0.393570.p4 type:complete len:524 gc:universal NODE_230_length_13723_cov_0.393570:5514-3943(-)